MCTHYGQDRHSKKSCQRLIRARINNLRYDMQESTQHKGFKYLKRVRKNTLPQWTKNFLSHHYLFVGNSNSSGLINPTSVHDLNNEEENFIKE